MKKYIIKNDYYEEIGNVLYWINKKYSAYEKGPFDSYKFELYHSCKEIIHRHQQACGEKYYKLSEHNFYKLKEAIQEAMDDEDFILIPNDILFEIIKFLDESKETEE